MRTILALMISTLVCSSANAAKKNNSAKLMELIKSRSVIEVTTDKSLEATFTELEEKGDFLATLEIISPEGKDVLFIDPNGQKTLIELSKYQENPHGMCWVCCGNSCPSWCPSSGGCRTCCK